MADEDDDERRDEGGDDGGGGGDADGGWAAGLEVLLDLATSVIEDAHAVGVAAVPSDPDAQLSRIAALRQAGSDLSVLANACEVLVRTQRGR